MTGLGLAAAESVVVGGLGAAATVLVQRIGVERQASTDRAGSSVPLRGVQFLSALVAGAAVWGITAWPVAGMWAALGGWAIPSLVRRDRERAAATARLDAWATWVGMIGGQLAAQASLAEALLGACRRAPAALAEELVPLAGALDRVPLDEALADWSAAEVASPELRQVGMVLQLAATGAGGHVSQVLGTLAAQLRARAGSARRVERERRRTRLAGRAAAGVALAWMLAGARLDASLFGVYSHPTGEVLLGGLLGVLAAGLWGLARLDRGLA